MTKDEIEKMPASRQMDSLVKSLVMGGLPPVGYDILWDYIPHYSTDITAAWQVAESFPIFYFESNKELKEYFSMIGSDFETAVTAETAPLAICRAALLWHKHLANIGGV